jgi:hypothetical protein
MLRNLRQNVVILTVVLSFFALSFATSVESAQTSRKPKAAPTPAKNTAKTTATSNKKTTAKATPAPSKKTQAKATPTPKKSSTAKTKTPDKKTAAKSATKDSSKDKTSAKTKQAASKQTASTKSNQKTTDKKAADKKANNSKSAKTDSKTAAKNSKPVTIAKNVSSAGKKESTKPAVIKTAAKTTSKTPVRAPEKSTTDEAPRIIVTDVAARIRSQAKSSAPELSQAKLGTVLQVSQKTPAWYKVQFTSGAKTSSGWISANSVNDLNSAGKEQIYRQIADRYYKNDGMNFSTASELYEFLTRASSESGNSDSAELELKRLLALRSALKAVPSGKAGENPYRQFLKTHEKSVVYSEPSGEWMVISSLFWDLHKKYEKSPLADQIAWEGAQNPLPGECEGYVNCNLFYTRMTLGEYLSLHPNGKRSLEALNNLSDSLEPIVTSLTTKSGYTGPTDVTDRAEFNNLIAELRTIVSRLPLTEKEKSLQHLKKIAEGFR